MIIKIYHTYPLVVASGCLNLMEIFVFNKKKRKDELILITSINYLIFSVRVILH